MGWALKVYVCMCTCVGTPMCMCCPPCTFVHMRVLYVHLYVMELGNRFLFEGILSCEPHHPNTATTPQSPTTPQFR